MEKSLIDFIAMAKRNTYSSLDSKPQKTEDGGKTYVVEEGDYTYVDTYFGNLIDCGQEKVLVKGKVVWVMSYRGGVFEKYENMHDEAFTFLKKCISKMPKEFPARGPKELNEGLWKYENKWQGDIEGFVGEENIYFSGEKVCFRNYVGGLIKNEDNKKAN